MVKGTLSLQQNSQILTEIGEETKRDNAAIVVLTQQARKDGRFAKTITFVAMLYLPASLVAVSTCDTSLLRSLVELLCSTHRCLITLTSMNVLCSLLGALGTDGL